VNKLYVFMGRLFWLEYISLSDLKGKNVFFV
jgi:hypothetical protein